MAIPLAPLAGAAIKYGPAAAAILATAAYAYSKERRVHVPTEDVLDDVDDGLNLTRTAEGDQVNAEGKYRRVIRLRNGKSYELDATFLGRIRIRSHTS